MDERVLMRGGWSRATSLNWKIVTYIKRDGYRYVRAVAEDFAVPTFEGRPFLSFDGTEFSVPSSRVLGRVALLLAADLVGFGTGTGPDNRKGRPTVWSVIPPGSWRQMEPLIGEVVGLLTDESVDILHWGSEEEIGAFRFPAGQNRSAS